MKKERKMQECEGKKKENKRKGRKINGKELERKREKKESQTLG